MVGIVHAIEEVFEGRHVRASKEGKVNKALDTDEEINATKDILLKQFKEN